AMSGTTATVYGTVRPGDLGGFDVDPSRQLAVQSLPDPPELTVHLGELAEQIVPTWIDRRIELLQAHAHLIAARLQQELVEPCEHALREFLLKSRSDQMR